MINTTYKERSYTSFMLKLAFFVAFFVFFRLNVGCLAFVINDWDYNKPENLVSPFATSLGGFNTTNSNDFYLYYKNPALLSYRRDGRLALNFKTQSSENSQNILLSYDQVRNVAGNSKICYFGMTGENIAFSVVPMVVLHDEIYENDLLKKYINYELTSYQLAGSEESGNISYGFTLKYLDGRLIFLEDLSMISDEENKGKKNFIDSKVKGFSLDLGLASQRNNFTYGFVLYDIFSKLYWNGHSNRVLQKKISSGVQLGDENFYIISGATANLFDFSNTLYHFGVNQRIYLYGFDRENSPSIPIRLGINFHELKSRKDVQLGIGSGYQVKMFSLDFSLSGNLKNFQNNDLIVSLSIGL